MKYRYAYKSPDGVRHEAEIKADSREQVFETLRAQGIRAIKVVATDGSKANGEIRGVRKRVVALIAVCAAVVAGGVFFALGTKHQAPSTRHQTPRHQIYGDPETMAVFERGDFSSVFSREGDRLLAWYAVPGRVMCPRGLASLNDVGIIEQLEKYAASELDASHDVKIADDDSREASELKAIVNGIREEFREYLANGNGNARSFWRRLNERTEAEKDIYERTRRELDSGVSDDIRAERNAALRQLGLRTIPAPKKAENPVTQMGENTPLTTK